MDRRSFLLTSLAGVFAAPLTAMAQPAGKVYRIGFLRNGPPPTTFIEGFRQGLRELGYVEGQNITLDYGLAGSADQLFDAATELVRRKVDVMIASGTPPVPVAKRATKTIPIIFVASIDPVATGLVASLARPGGNLTGFAGTHADLMGKRLDLLRESVLVKPLVRGPCRTACRVAEPATRRSRPEPEGTSQAPWDESRHRASSIARRSGHDSADIGRPLRRARLHAE